MHRTSFNTKPQKCACFQSQHPGHRLFLDSASLAAFLKKGLHIAAIVIRVFVISAIYCVVYPTETRAVKHRGLNLQYYTLCNWEFVSLRPSETHRRARVKT